MILPPDHAQRRELNDEVHARPPEPLSAPARISFLALLGDAAQREAGWQHIVDLAVRFGVDPPPPGANHYSVDFGPFRLKWERHTEFTRLKFIVAGAGPDPFAAPAIAAVPADWVASLPGELLVAAHTAILRASEVPDDYETISSTLFEGNALVGSQIASGAATAFTDFRLHADGFSRAVLLDRDTTPRQAGRLIQRLMEIDAYRMMALLALPLARELGPFLTARERELASISSALVKAGDPDEPLLLDRLTLLEAEIESRQSENLFRFSASVAYHELVQRRIAELRERRIPGLQTFQEFTERRLAPAMNTVRAVAARQEALSQRLARATQLLSTRVDITTERQNQAVLESMDRRAKVQLELQETVEGLSVAAITYYIVGLVGYAAKGLKAAGVHVDPEIAIAVSIPVVVIVVAWGVGSIRRAVTRGFAGRRAAR